MFRPFDFIALNCLSKVENIHLLYKPGHLNVLFIIPPHGSAAAAVVVLSYI
jgi:hypothetical protein